MQLLFIIINRDCRESKDFSINIVVYSKDGGTGWLRSNYPCNVNAVLYY